MDMKDFDFAPCTSEDLEEGSNSRKEVALGSLVSWFAEERGLLGLPREGET